MKRRRLEKRAAVAKVLIDSRETMARAGEFAQAFVRFGVEVTLLPFQPYDSLPDMLGAADVAIALLEPEAGIFSVPSKVLSYFSDALGFELIKSLTPTD